MQMPKAWSLLARLRAGLAHAGFATHRVLKSNKQVSVDTCIAAPKSQKHHMAPYDVRCLKGYDFTILRFQLILRKSASLSVRFSTSEGANSKRRNS